MRKFSIQAKSPSSTSFGKGQVRVESPCSSTLVFHETGQWESGMGFSNIFGWKRTSVAVSLEHLRFGQERAVFLFDLVPVEGGLQSASAHLCGEDRYFGSVRISPESLDCNWIILGPKKNDEVLFRYFH